MTDKNPSTPAGSESQRQRWLKYGGNVVATCVIAVALAALVTFAAERKPLRVDTTATGMYSLKPQTLKIIKDLKTPIRLVSLYTSSKPPASPDDEDQSQISVVPPAEAAQTVNDLLHEYATKGKNITVETIDPVTSPTKVDDLIEQVEAQYGGEVTKYKNFVNSFEGTIKNITTITDAQEKAIDPLQQELQKATDQDLITTFREVLLTIQQFPQSMAELQQALQRPLKQKPPDYKGASDAITEGMGSLSEVAGAIINNFGVLQKRGGLPPAIAKYMSDSLPEFVKLKKIADDSLAQGKTLGELKLDTLRSALRERNTILVMGDKEWRAINYDQVWQLPVRTVSANTTPPRPRFAGEQQVTAAILGLASGGAKPKVVFVRAGGQPLTQSMGFGGGDAPLSDVAARLTLYNYDVLEKDLTGQFAQQGGGAEPSDDEIKDATWVVWAMKPQQANPFGGAPPSIAPQVAEHLKEGGSAVILTGAKQDPMAEALSDWGISVDANSMIVHEPVTVSGEQSTDMIQQAIAQPYIFDLHEYGDAGLARPLDGLEGIFIGLSPVTIHSTAGYTAQPLLPVPTAPDSPRSWASASYMPPDPNAPASPPLVFDPKVDQPGPLFAGAAIEKNGGNRVVVLSAGGAFVTNQILELGANYFDPNAPPVIRFPANGELFTNSVFWASRQDTLIDISPAAMDIGRIRDIKPGALAFWHVGVMLIGLPGLALLSGLGVYLKRRD
jgi:hypothetical protein